MQGVEEEDLPEGFPGRDDFHKVVPFFRSSATTTPSATFLVCGTAWDIFSSSQARRVVFQANGQGLPDWGRPRLSQRKEGRRRIN